MAGPPRIGAPEDERLRFLQRAVEQSTDGVFIADLDGRLLFVNPAWLRLHGFAPDARESLGELRYEDFQAPDDDGGDSLLDLLRKHGSLQKRVRHRRRDGTSFPVSMQADLLHDDDGKPVGFTGSVRDISARDRVERFHYGQRRVLELLGTGAPLEQVLDELVRTTEVICKDTLGSVLVLDDETKCLRHGAAPHLPDEYNRAVDGIVIGPKQGSCGTAAFRRELVVVRDIHEDPLWEDYRDLAARFGLRACWSHPILSKNRVLGTFAMYYRTPRGPTDAELRLIEAAAHLAGVAIRRERVEHELRESEERYRVLVENAPEAVLVYDVERRHFVAVNENAVRLLERSRQQLLRMGPAEISAPRQFDGRPTAEVAEEQIRRVLAGERLVFEWLFSVGQGRRMACEVRLVRLPYRGRDSIRASVIDISERKRIEQLRRRQHELVQEELRKVSEQLVRKTRLAAIGQVAASIAHDLRNPLGAIRNAEYYLKSKVPESEAKWIEYLGIIEHEVTRADGIVTNLLQMTRTKAPLKQQIELGGSVRAAFDRVESRGVRLVVDLASEPFVVHADPGHLDQVLENLLTNAVQAMAGGDGEVHVAAHAEDGFDVITVRDEGPGVPSEARASVFEPLFTTKAQGTGLGLSICRQLVERHGGTIELVTDGAPPTGATFRVRLPQGKAD